MSVYCMILQLHFQLIYIHTVLWLYYDNLSQFADVIRGIATK